jgi:8-hydroxy-5-deazaflavin:NADPH oxidoreductase
MTNITIVGTGRMATGLGTGWANAGHTITFTSRDPEAKAGLAEQVPGARVVTLAEGLASAEVVVITLPFATVEPFAREHAAVLRSKVVIDISNPFGRDIPGGLSGAELTAAAIGPGARVVAAFKDNFSDTLLEPVDPIHGIQRDVHFAGDDEAAKAVVEQLTADLGFQPVDCGPLRHARVLDGMVPLIVELDRRYGEGGRRSSWKLLN